MDDDEVIEFTVRVDDLKGRWQRLVREVPTERITSDWWLVLERRHSEPQRHYHTLEHLAELFSFLDSPFGADIAPHRRPLVEFAIFFHDAVYEPTSRTNEEDSEVLWRRFAAEAGLSSLVTSTVSDWILWTKAQCAARRSNRRRTLADFEGAFDPAMSQRGA